MAYFCFLCNANHDGSPTEEHFIPKSLDGPAGQWLPVCEWSNTRSNSLFDSKVRDIVYLVRFQHTRALKRSGEALLRDGSLKRFHFSYQEDLHPDIHAVFRDIWDRETNARIPNELIYAISFPVGLSQDECRTLCRGLAKISLGAVVFLLQRKGIPDSRVRQMFSQTSIDAVRHFALDLPRPGKSIEIRFSLGRSDVLSRLQTSCEHQQIRNHKLRIGFQSDKIHVEGMLYSQYGWKLDLSNRTPIPEGELCLENPIHHMSAPVSLRDMTFSRDSICVINPGFVGQRPDIPQHWRNS